MLKRIFCTALLLTFFILNTKAGNDEEKKVKTEIWNNAPPEFAVTAVPKKWENESAVVIATRLDYELIKSKVEKVYSHHRIKLLDKAAVKEFSELSFNEKYVNTNLFGKANSYFFVGIKIIKANGTEKEIDLSKAVKADSDSRKQMKFAVPDLEVGDIIDYFSAGRQEYDQYFIPEMYDSYLFEGEYPIINKTVRFKFNKYYDLSSKVYNGAPDFVKTTKEDDNIYTLIDTMRNKSEDLLWTYDHRTAPEIRYHRTSSSAYNQSVTDMARSYLSNYNPNLSNIGFIMDYFDENFKKETDPKIIVNELYNLLRNPLYLNAYFDIEPDHPMSAEYHGDLFFRLINKVLIKKKIGHNIMLLPSAEFGPLSEHLNISTCDAVIRVNTTPPMYIGRVSPFAMVNEVPYAIEGMEGIVGTIWPAKFPDNDNSKSVPKTTFENNSTTTTMTVNMNADDNSRVDVKRSTVCKGHNKLANQYLAVTNYDYLKAYDQPKYQAESSSLISSILKKYNKEKDKLEQRLTQDYNQRDERLKADIESSMEVKVAEYKNFNLKNIGMWENAPNLEFSDEFTVENIIKKAGPNYIIEIPKLIEQQVEIKDKQLKRDRDIYMNYARSFINEINFTIPDGYTVEGIEALNKEVKNSTGGFISKARIEGKTL
ncbi:MAG TPA: DUF3857 domain-containing protein, partial [Bacteroidia bacterium]|nr:DUF3857 domain-containing protein [Bacteroidia bacterium]